MPTLEINRCTLTIETTPPFRQYGWVMRGVAPHYCLPFRSLGERSHVLLCLARRFRSTAANTFRSISRLTWTAF